MLLEQFLRGGALPVLAALAVPLVGLLRSTVRRETFRMRYGACGLGIGFLAGHVALFGVPQPVPADNWGWLVHVAACVSLATALSASCASHRGVFWTAAGLAALAAAALLVPSWQDSRSVWIAVLAGTILLEAASIYVLGKRTADWSPTLALVIAAAAAVLVFERAATARFAQLAGVSAASAGGCLAVALFLPRLYGGPAAAAGGAALLATITFSGYFSHVSDVPAASFFLVTAAPLAPWLGQAGAMRRLKGWKRAAVDTVAVIVPVGTAIGLAVAG